jgi:hypothetical protein
MDLAQHVLREVERLLPAVVEIRHGLLSARELPGALV